MKRTCLLLILGLWSLSGYSQFIILLDKGDTFTSPEEDMVVMDRYSFARMNYVAEKYDTLSTELLRYDSLLASRDCTEADLRRHYERLIQNKDAQIEAIAGGYISLKNSLQTSLEEQNRLQLDYLRLEKKSKRIKRWRNFFLGTSAALGGLIYIMVR